MSSGTVNVDSLPPCKLSPSETDYLAHHFYQLKPIGSVENVEELQKLLNYANIQLPRYLLEHCFTVKQGQTKNGLFDCDCFLETCEVAKSLELVALFSPSDELAEDVDVLVSQLANEKPPEVPAAIVRQLCSKAQRSHAFLPQSAVRLDPPSSLPGEELLHAYAEALGADDNEMEDEDNHTEEESPTVDFVTTARKSIVENVVAAESAVDLAHRSSLTPLVTARRATRLSKAIAASFIQQPTKPPSLMETSRQLLQRNQKQSQFGKSSAAVSHYAIRKNLAQFGLAEDPTEQPLRPLSSIGVGDEVDDTEGLLDDPTLYVSLSKKQLCEMLRSKQQNKKQSKAAPHSGDETRNAVEEEHGEQLDLLDVQDDLDGMQELLSFLRMEQERATSPSEDEYNEPSVTLVEDPASGEVTAADHTSTSIYSERQQKKVLSDAAFERLRRVAVVESDLFVSPLRKTFLEEVKLFLAGGVPQINTSLSVTPRGGGGFFDHVNLEGDTTVNPSLHGHLFEASARHSPEEPITATSVTPPPPPTTTGGTHPRHRAATLVGGTLRGQNGRPFVALRANDVCRRASHGSALPLAFQSVVSSPRCACRRLWSPCRTI